MSEPRRIALFGGTFDPVHLGHIHMAALAQQALDLDEVRFLPCRKSPHKADTHPSSTADRLEMLRLATADLPWAVVDDFETRRDGLSYSYQTAEAMAAAHPGARLFWIMGGDQWEVLPQWAQSARLARCVEFIVFARGGNPAPRAGYTLHPLVDEHPASATAIRQAITAGEFPPPWVAPAVAEWIKDHQLYQTGS